MPVPDFQGVQVLVTGGAGFIGSHLSQALLRRGAAVRVLDDLSTGHRRNLEGLEGELELLQGDIRDPAICKAACEGVRFVFHQAALGSVPRSMADPTTSLGVNVQGTANIFDAARAGGAERVVYASSSSVYGDSPSLPKREGEEGRPLSPYALSKRMCEELADVFARCYGQELVGLRYFNIYGPRQDPEGPYAAVIPRFFRAFIRREPPTIHGDGEQSRDFTFVADAVQANLKAAGAPREACGRAYNVARGERIIVNELARLVREATGSPVEARHGDPRPGDVRHSLADLSDARRALDYVPSSDHATGLAACLDYYRELHGR